MRYALGILFLLTGCVGRIATEAYFPSEVKYWNLEGKTTVAAREFLFSKGFVCLNKATQFEVAGEKRWSNDLIRCAKRESAGECKTYIVWLDVDRGGIYVNDASGATESGC
jgi:hypothetical protein